MGSSGLEPPTSRLSGVRSNLLSYEPSSFPSASGLLPGSRRLVAPLPGCVGGDERVRTDDPLLAKQVLSQLSYTPTVSRPSSFLPLNGFLQHAQNYTVQALASRAPSPDPVGAVIRASRFFVVPRKEVIQPHLPIRLPCYDFTPVIGLTFDSSPLTVRILASGAPNSHGVTGGVYKARERIHRGMLIRDY